jgi:hypothetical protein
MENSSININNYEEFIVNYLDGKTSPIETAELFLFLEIHPELNENIDELRKMIVTADSNLTYGFSEALKLSYDTNASQISPDNYTYYFVAAIEGDLTSKGTETLNRFIAEHPELAKEWELLHRCKVEAPAHLTFPNKESLKIKPKVTLFPYYLRWAAAAASILILISVFVRLEPETSESIENRLGAYEVPVQGKPVKQQENDKAGKENEKSAVKKDVNPEAEKAKSPSVKKESAKENMPARTEQEPINNLPALKPTINNAQPFEGSTRNTYTSLYNDIRLSQELMLAYAENQEQPATEEGQGIRLGRRVNSYIQSGTQVASQVSESFGGWMLADLGVKGYNMLTDNEVKLIREVREDGSTGNIRLEDGSISYSLRKSPL